MTVWFMTLAVLEFITSRSGPRFWAALSPHHGLAFFFRHGPHGMLILGSVVLAVTWANRSTRIWGILECGPFAWRGRFRAARTGVVLPGTRGRCVLRDPRAIEIRSIRSRPGMAEYLLILFSSAATVIASQARFRERLL